MDPLCGLSLQGGSVCPAPKWKWQCNPHRGDFSHVTRSDIQEDHARAPQACMNHAGDPVDTPGSTQSSIPHGR